MDSLVNRANTVPQRQKLYQADTRPVYQRLPRSRLYMGATLTLFAIGMYGSLGGLVMAAQGKKVEDAK